MPSRTNFRTSAITRCLGAVAALAVSSAAHAASPSLDQVLPRGAQRGTEVEMTLRGGKLADAQEVFIYQPGITVTDFKAESGGIVKCKFKIAPDAKFGEYQLRLRTATGISELRNFYVGVYPTVAETAVVGAKPSGDPKKPTPPENLPSTFAKPQKLEKLNVTVAGVLENEQADFYAVECKKGQRLNVEMEGTRLGQILDTNVTIFDQNRFEVAGNDDNALSRQDAFVTCTIPADGTYIIQVRESSYAGGPNGHYRMHVGTFPRPRAVYPAGGKAGDEVKVRFIGDAAGPFEQTVKVPATPGEVYPLLAEQDGLLAPTPNPFRVSLFDNVLEGTGPNDDLASATAYAGDLPVAFNGIIDKPGDIDFFKFKAKKGQALEINVYGRRLRTPLDPVLTLHNEKGGQIAANDDSGGPDSYLRFNVPADGEYALSVRDHLKHGGPEFVYRIEITEVKPALTLTIPNMGVNFTQDRQWVVVPKGGRFGTTIRATRSEFGGDLKLIANDLPPGVTMKAEPLLQGVDLFAVVFEAAKDAPVGGKLVELTAKPTDDKVAVAGRFQQKVELAQSGNNAPYFVSTATKLAVAVAEEAPYTLEVVAPKVPMVQSGLTELKLKVTRKGDFKGAVAVRSVWEPPGTGAGQVTIKPEETEGTLTLNAQANARLGKWRTAFLGSSDAGGAVWVASDLFDLEVAAPYVTAAIQRTTVLQGEKTQVTVKLDQKAPFDGKAKIQLLGLPTEATTTDKDITKDDKEVVFDVQTTLKTPAATHNGLVCRVTVTKDGEPIVHNLGAGGILRVDALKKPGSPEPAKGKPKPVAAAK
jgi:hypothetical protein